MKFINIAENITGVESGGAECYQVLFHYFILVIGFIILLIFSYFAFVILGGIVSAPFNEKLSRFIEEKVTGQKIIYDVGFFKD